MYETLILIDPSNDISADSAEAALAGLASNASRTLSMSRSGDSIRIEWPGFHLSIVWSGEPHVVRESEDIASNFATDKPQRDAIASCASRFEIAGGDDFDMEYFNDYCLVVERLEGLGTVYTFDANSAEFMNL